MTLDSNSVLTCLGIYIYIYIRGDIRGDKQCDDAFAAKKKRYS